jgi:hypothetical protein
MTDFRLKNLLRLSAPTLGTALLLASCAPNQDAPTPTAAVNLSQYVAVGDSYTAGFSAGGLTRTSQEYSYANLLARQFSSVAPGAPFTQPLLEAGPGTGYREFQGFDAAGFPLARMVAGRFSRGTVTRQGTCGPDVMQLIDRNAGSALPQNLGVPGLRLSETGTPGYGNENPAAGTTTFNPYFERLLPANDNRTYLQTVTTASTSATFFTFFQGLDDLLPYLRSGGTCGPQLPAEFSAQLTTPMTQNARAILNVLTNNGTRPGIIAKLPAVTNLPLLREGRGLQLQARLQAYYGDTARIYIQGPNNPAIPQPISDDDYVLATALPRVGQLTAVTVGSTTLMLPYGRDSRNPIRDVDVLDRQVELSRLSSVISGYNNYLELTLAQNLYKMPVLNTSGGRTLDLDIEVFSQIANSISVGGVVYSADPVRGNFFTLDYASLTPRGNAVLANAFIRAINTAYKASLPVVDVNSLPTTAQ